VASYISFVVIVALIVLNILPRTSKKEILDKSIAVLPFRNDSPDEERMYFINGTMEAILDNLCKIEDLRVPGRTSVEQYRDVSKAIPIIAEELSVTYIIEGSGQKLGNRILLTVQLLDGINDKHLWSKQYDRKIESIEELIDMQSEIAQLVAEEIEAVITPEEKELIEKTPTLSLTAYDFYQQGLEEHQKFWTSNNWKALNNAEDFYNKALKYDSVFARAYSGLAKVYWNKDYWREYFTEDFLDTVLYLADMALSFDGELAEAYTIKGECYRRIGDREQANKEYDKAIDFNPNDWMAYRGKGLLYLNDDFIIQIDNMQKAAFLNQGPELPSILRDLWWAFTCIGFEEKAISYELYAQKLDEDSLLYYFALATTDYFKGNFKKAIDIAKKGYEIDSTNLGILDQLGFFHMYLGKHEEALKYLQRKINSIKQGNLSTNEMHRIGYIYWENGMEEEAYYYFDKQIEYGTSEIELGRSYGERYFAYYDLAGTYAFIRETDKAYENLKIFNQKKVMPIWMVMLIHHDPLFDSIRDEPEFQQIVHDVEAKYQAEHERVKQWLEENDRL